MQLPAWQWGKREDGSYGVIDPHSASDADLWFAYALIEAGRLWHQPSYTEMGRALANRIAISETVELPDFGVMLLPGSSGFHPGADLWRVNPSYLPLPLLRLLAHEAPSGPWSRLAANTARMIHILAPHGFVPDWAGYRTGQGFVVDPVKGDLGSYDAIRTYLWAGMTAPGDPLAADLLGALDGMQHSLATLGVAPEKVASVSGLTGSTSGPIGFYAALLPYLQASNQAALGAAALSRIAALESAPNAPVPPYYDRVLMLFGRGWAEGRYRFTAQGRLAPRWEKSCHTATAR
jgi:endoglucanase